MTTTHDSVDPAARARDLLSEMTVAEKAQQLVGVLPHALVGASGLDTDKLTAQLGNGIGHICGVALTGADAAGVAHMTNAIQRHLVENTRLGIPAIIHNEALNGIAGKGFTSFPTGIALAAGWDPELVREMADLIRRQARAVGITQALSPVLDVARDARWGRFHETYGEEVLLVTAMGVSYVGGLQGEDLREGVLAMAKHFLGYAMTEAGQNLAATHFGPRELYDVYATPFEAAIRLAGLRSVMNSYSEIDGEPVGLSKAVLTDLLRGRLGLDGTVGSDYRTIQYLVERQGVARTPEEAGALALEAGLDVEFPAAYGFGSTLAEAVDAGRVPVELLDRATVRVLTHKFELGLFEHPYVTTDGLDLRALASQGRDVSRRLATQAVTLLKNEGGLLPLDPATRRIAVVGPHADSTIVLFANYTYPATLEMMRGMATGEATMVGMEGALGDMTPTMRKAAEARLTALASIDLDGVARTDYDAVSLAEAVRELLPDATVTAAAGTGVIESDPQDMYAAVRAAADADVVILALGGRSGAFAGKMTEGEGIDSASIDLPAHQVELARQVAALGKPTAAVIFGGRPYGLAELDALVDGLVLAYYPGPEGPRALARVLFGEDSPSGKLPFTLPRHTGQVPIYQAQKRGSGYRREPIDMFKGYADLPNTPLYPFGHGLSYTDFTYGEIGAAPALVAPDGRVSVSVRVTNSGTRAGTEVVQVYASTQAVGVTRPAQQLVGFARVELEPAAAADVEVTFGLSQLGYTDRDGRFVVQPGELRVGVGSSSADLRAESRLTIVGTTTDVGTRRSYLPDVVVRPVDGAVAP